MRNKVTLHHRELVRLPDLSSISPQILKAIVAAQSRLTSVSPAACVEVAALCKSAYYRQEPAKAALIKSWRHPLSPWAMERTSASCFEPEKSSHEATSLHVHTDAIERYFDAGSVDDLVVLLEQLASELTGTPTTLRTGQVGTQVDSAGERIVFPPSGHVPERMAELHWFIQKYAIVSPLLTALVSMVAITNCHPFRDGNGRTSRLIFNAVLRSAKLLGKGAYLPLYECFWLSQRGYEIRVRMAEIRDDWEPVMMYICDVVTVLAKLSDSLSKATSKGLSDSLAIRVG